MVGLRRTATAKLPSGVKPRVVEQHVKSIKDERSTQQAFAGVQTTALHTRKRVMKSDSVNAKNEPLNRSFSSTSDGQYFHVSSTGASSIVKIKHDLGRVPQGAMWIKQPTAPSLLLLDPTVNKGFVSDSEYAYFQMAGASGEVGIALLF